MRTRSDRWVIGGIVLLALVAICALVGPVGRRRRCADRAAVEHRGADHQRPGRAWPHVDRVARVVDRHRADLVRVPVAALRSGRRSPRWRRLHDRLWRHASRPPTRTRRRRLPDAGARHRDERGRIARRRIESDRDGRRAAGQHGAAVAARVDGRRPGRHRRARVRGPARRRSRSRTGGCAATRPAASARRSPAGARGTTASARATSARKLRFNVTARNSLGQRDGDLDGVRGRDRAVAVRRDPLPSGEYSIPAVSVPSNHRLIVSQVQFSPNPVTGAQPGAHGARAREGHAWVRDPRRTRLRALDARASRRAATAR